jgi:hypothetical protein
VVRRIVRNGAERSRGRHHPTSVKMLATMSSNCLFIGSRGCAVGMELDELKQ